MRQTPHHVGAVKLSKTQLRVLASIKQGEEVTAQHIAERCELSPSWASSLLREVSKRGYMNRISSGLVAGGVEYIYKMLE